MKKKLAAVTLAAAMLLTGIAGCGSKQNGGTADNAQSLAQATETDDNFNAEGYPIVKEPITLKVMFAIRDVDSMIEPNEMPAVKALEEQMGCHQRIRLVNQIESDVCIWRVSGYYFIS